MKVFAGEALCDRMGVLLEDFADVLVDRLDGDDGVG